MSGNVQERVAGMGCIPVEGGVAFRVWAPHAERVEVIGSFNDWNGENAELEHENGGYWYGFVERAQVGDEYKFRIHHGDQVLDRIDPHAREVTNSVGNAVVHDRAFDWEGDDFQMPPWNEVVIYEMHLGTFARRVDDQPGDFDTVKQKFDYLKQLGVNVLQIMPAAEFAGDISWGYNPAHIFAVESAYGGPQAFKRFVKDAHAAGFAVVLDVVYNHFGPSDLDLWQFDGWSENGKGGIYFYNDHRAATPWGETRPDYGRGEVRQYIHDNAMMWLDDYHVDGLRYDMTLFIRSVDGSSDLPDGWGLTQWINRTIREKHPDALTIAEDLQNNPYMTKPESEGGAGFGTQWDAGFVHPIRRVLAEPEDQYRSMQAVCGALHHQYNGDVFQRVIYTESHDEVANGKSRVPSEVAPGVDDNFFAQKLSSLGGGLVLTAPGIPMLFQGQEFLQSGWFDDTKELDWEQNEEFGGIRQLYADLIRLRLNRDGNTAGLTGQDLHVFHVNDGDKVIAFRRGREGGPGDDTVVVINFSCCQRHDYRIGFPAVGTWKQRFCSDSHFYSESFENNSSGDCDAIDESYDAMPASGAIHLGPYSVLIYSQDPE